jgi:hypothetical protein
MTSVIKNIHLYYQKITELFPTIVDLYPDDTEQFIFLGDLFYAYVIQNNIDIFTIVITYSLIQDYISFYHKIKNLNINMEDVAQEQNEYYKIKINSIMNTYNDYFMNNPLNHTPEFVLDFSRFTVLNEILVSDISIHSMIRMPNSLKIFHATHCMLKHIDRIPFSTEYVSCAYNQLTRLPDLERNDSLRMLGCNNNFLSKLPRMPDSINRLFCNYNLLKGMPVHLPASLKILFCDHNHITKINTLPPRLNMLSCGHNRLKELNCVIQLQYLKVLYCNNNLLEELPPLPVAIQEVNHKENPITNYFPYPTGIRVY